MTATLSDNLLFLLPYQQFLAFVFGSCLGSFLNVVIHRLPLGQSIVSPGSTCPQCRNAIRFYDNIPLLSYILLRGRCRNCQTPISIRYWLVELMCGLAALASITRFDLTAHALIVFFLVAALLTITFIDLAHQIIPDAISLPGIVIGLVLSFFSPAPAFRDALIGVAAGGGSLTLVAWSYALIAKRQGMGGGDIKLLAMIGAFCGWQGVLFTIFMASISGTLVGLTAMLIARGDFKTRIPFGPFLSLATVLYAFCGPQLIAWYFSLGAGP